MLRIVFFFFECGECVSLLLLWNLVFLGLGPRSIEVSGKKASINNEGLWIRSCVSWTNGQLLQKWIKVLKKPNPTKCHIGILLLLWRPLLLWKKKNYVSNGTFLNEFLLLQGLTFPQKRGASWQDQDLVWGCIARQYCFSNMSRWICMEVVKVNDCSLTHVLLVSAKKKWWQ